MNTLILKILCWINGIKNPFMWAAEQEKRDYKSIEHVIDNARFFTESTHELAYDHGYSDGQIEVLDKIRAEIESYVSEEPHQLMSKTTVLEIIDKYREVSE